MNLNNLLQWYKYQNVNLFENCSVPTPINMDDVINNIILRCGLLTPIYNDPSTFKEMTHMWFIANQYNFDHLVKIIQADYSPIENVAEWVQEHTDKNGNSTDIHSGKDTTTYGKTLQKSGDDTESESGNTTTTHEVSAYNSGGYQADSKDTTNHGKSTTLSHGEKSTESGDDIFQHGHTIENSHNDDEFISRYRHGNVGVTTNNQLLNEEKKWLENFNPYTWIAAKYEREMFIQVY